jgi:N-acetylmuramoyl-L-alanine amidase
VIGAAQRDVPAICRALARAWSSAGSSTKPPAAPVCAWISPETPRSAAASCCRPGDGSSAYRYVIDLKAVDGAVPPEAPRLTFATTPVKAAPLRLKKVIVIDAGHGGKDPGSLGANVHEKDVTLAAAMALKERLERTGRFQVVLTRETDTFIPLESRVQIARRADADSFISMHADSGPDATTRGASGLHPLRKGHRTRRPGAREGRLADEGQSSGPRPRRQPDPAGPVATRHQEPLRRLRRNCCCSVGEETTLLRRSHRDAGFIVLLAPDVPAVLLEMGFITNPDDEAFLTTKSSRARLVSAVADSIEAYFSAGLRKS